MTSVSLTLDQSAVFILALNKASARLGRMTDQPDPQGNQRSDPAPNRDRRRPTPGVGGPGWCLQGGIMQIQWSVETESSPHLSGHYTAPSLLSKLPPALGYPQNDVLFYLAYYMVRGSGVTVTYIIKLW